MVAQLALENSQPVCENEQGIVLPCVQCSKAEHDSYRELDSPLHLNSPQQNSRENGEGKVGNYGDGREEEADSTVESGTTRPGRGLAP